MLVVIRFKLFLKWTRTEITFPLAFLVHCNIFCIFTSTNLANSDDTMQWKTVRISCSLSTSVLLSQVFESHLFLRIFLWFLRLCSDAQLAFRSHTPFLLIFELPETNTLSKLKIFINNLPMIPDRWIENQTVRFLMGRRSWLVYKLGAGKHYFCHYSQATKS